MGKVATSPLPYRGSPPLQSGGQNQKWPTSGQSGYLTPAVSGIPTPSERGGKIRSGPQVGKVATSPLPYRGSPPLQSGGQNQKWPTSGQNGYLTPAVSGIPTASQRGGKIRSGPQVGKAATSPLPYRGSPPLQSGGQNQKWPTSGQNGYLGPAVSGIPPLQSGGGKIRSGPQVCKVATSPLPYRGSPPLQSGGAKSEVAHKWAKWLPHPCRIGDPHRFRAGGKIRSGPQVGKVATSPLPYRGSPPLQSGGAKSEVAHKWAKWLPRPCRIGDPTASERGGQNQKWPTSVQSGYLTPAVSGIPTASERGGKIRSGPQVGKMATSPLPYRGSPPLQRGGQNQKWPTSGQNGYLTPAVSGGPTASERGAKSEVAHKWAKWLPHPCRIGDPHRFTAGGQNQKWPTSGQSGYLTPAVSGIPTASERGGKIRSGPQMGKVATSPLPYRGSPPLQSGGAKSEVAHKWAKWLPHPCRIGDPHRFRAGGQNQKWPTSGQSGYLTPAVSGIPTASERGGKIRSGPQVGKMATSPLPYRGSPPLHSGGAKSEVAHKWAKRLPHPCRIGDPHRFRAGGKIRSGPQVGKMATSALPYRGSHRFRAGGAKSEVAHKCAKWLPHPCRIGDPHRFRAGGQNQKWPTSGQNGYLTPAVSGIPTASERGAKSEVAHKWANWLPHPCRIGDPHRFRAGGQNQKWPTSGQSGYLTPAVSGIPTASERGAKSEVAHKWAKWLPHPCRIGDPTASKRGGQNQKWPTSVQSGYLTPALSGIPTASERGGKIRSGPQVGKMATSHLPYRGSPPLQRGGQNQKWPTSGQNGYLTPAVSGGPTASERGAKSEVAHKWAKWLPHPCPIGDPHRFRAGGQNQKWPTSGQNGYLTPAVSGIPTASEGGAKSEVAHKWAKWLPHPCRIGGPHRLRAGGKIRSGPQVGKAATSPLPYRGSPPLQSGGQNQKWPTSGQSGYLTPAVSGIPTASEPGAKSEVAHKCAKWLPHPCRIGDPHRFRAGGKIRSGPQVGKMATSPLPYRGSPPLQSGGGKIRSGPQVGKVATSPLPYRGSPPLQSRGQNQKWPTSGQSGYLTPAVSGIPTTSERGAKSEMAHKWARWLPHPCRIGDPHRFRAGGQNQKWPTSGQSGYLRSSVTPNEQSCKLIPGFEIASAKGKASIRLHHNLPVSVTTLARCK